MHKTALYAERCCTLTTYNRRPITEQLAEALEKTGGSVNPKVDGHLIRLSGAGDPWPIDKPWPGREITGYAIRKTLWNHTVRINFHVDMTSTVGKLPIFSLQLALPMTDEEIHTAAETYMTLLNLARVDR